MAKANTKSNKKTAKPTAPKTVAKPVESVAGPSLDGVIAALGAKDGAGALTAAVSAWRAARAPELADLIDAISSRITGAPITSDDDWTRASTGKDPVVLGRLLAGIREIPVSSLPTAALRLAAFDDPRVATAARGWILDPPTTSTSAYPFWTKLLDHLAKLGDPRLRPAIAKRRKMAPPMNAPWKGAKPRASQFWDKLYNALETLDGKLAKAPSATADAKAIAKLDKQAAALRVIETTAPAKPSKASGQTRQSNVPPLPRALALVPTDIKGAIDALLEAWRAKRAPELADLIERASRMLPSYRRALPAGDKPAHAAWKAAFAEDPSANLPLLVANVNRGGSSAAIEQVADLSTLPDDPRIALRLAEIAHSHSISPQKPAYWSVVWSVIARTADPRVCVPLRRAFNDFTGTYYDHHRSGKRLAGDFVLAPPPPSPLDADDHKAINQIATALAAAETAAQAGDQERLLIADIVRSWSDEGPRLVYADWLTEREHLRGELIVLSCKQFRERTLGASEKKRLAALCGGFRAVTQVFGPISDLEYELDRGIPVHLKLQYNASTITLRRLAGDPLLPCVESIDLIEAADLRGRPLAEDLARVMLDPTATRLAEVTNVAEDATTTLASELEGLVKAAWKRRGPDFLRR